MRILIGWLKWEASEGCGARRAFPLLLVAGAQDVGMRSAIINPAMLEIVRAREKVTRRDMGRFHTFLVC